MTTAATIATALAEVFRELDGLTGVQVGEPATFHAGSPFGYILLDSNSIRVTGQRSARVLRYLLRIMVPTQDYTAAEELILAFMDPVVAAIEADPQLGGVVTSGIAAVTDQRGVWFSVGGLPPVRALDSFIEVVNKVAYGS